MTARRVPYDIFERYVALGPGRSCRELARQCGVSKRAITRRARAEDWNRRLGKIEAAATVKIEEKLIDDLASMDARHLKMVAVLQSRALEALRAMPIHSAAAAAKALDAAIGRERAIRGAPDMLRGAAIQNNVHVTTLEELVCAVNVLDEQGLIAPPSPGAL
jgi:hypothetical protein